MFSNTTTISPPKAIKDFGGLKPVLGRVVFCQFCSDFTPFLGVKSVGVSVFHSRSECLGHETVFALPLNLQGEKSQILIYHKLKSKRKHVLLAEL